MEKDLVLFTKVANAGSFSKAAESSYISRQAIIKQIDHLEDRIGVQLFIRNSRGVTLTEAGKLLHNGVSDLIRREQELLGTIQNLKPSKTIYLSKSFHRTNLDPIIDEYSRLHPDISIIRKIFGNHDEVDLIRNNMIDIGEVTADKSKTLSDDILYTKILDVPIRCTIPCNHPLANNAHISCNMLKDMTVYLEKNLISCLKSNGLYSYLEEDCNLILIQSDSDRLHQIQTFDFTNGVYLSAAPINLLFADYISIPLKDAGSKEYGIIYTKSCSAYIKHFIKFAENYY